MTTLQEQMKRRQSAEYLEFIPLEEASIKVNIGVANLTAILNSRIEDFVTFTILGDEMFVFGFLGDSSIARKFDVEVEGRDRGKNIEFSMLRDKVRLLNNMKDLSFEVKNNELTWKFQYGKGIIAQRMRPSRGFHTTTEYLNFIRNYKAGNDEGKVNSSDLSQMRRLVTQVSNDKMEHNVMIGRNKLYISTEEFVAYKTVGARTDIMITDSILSNLPRKDTEMSCITFNNFSGLVNDEEGIFYIFRAYQSDIPIDVYTEIRPHWVANLTPNAHKAIGILAFGEETNIEMTFHSKEGVVNMSVEDNPENKYISVAEVMEDRTVTLPSYIEKFSGVEKIGVTKDSTHSHLKFLLLEGNITCLLT